MQGSVGYNLIFASAVCVVCAVFVSSSAVSLKERQDYNANLDKQRNVLVVSGLAEEDERLSSDEVERRRSPIDGRTLSPGKHSRCYPDRRPSPNPEFAITGSGPSGARFRCRFTGRNAHRKRKGTGRGRLVASFRNRLGNG